MGLSPVVFSTSGDMGTTATVVYIRIASQIAEKQQALQHNDALDLV